MPSYNAKLKCEIARRDAALRAIRGNISGAADAVSGAVHDGKDSLRPSHLVARFPWGSVLAAAAAGFVVVPLVRSAVAAISRQPEPQPQSQPQRVIIEVAGAAPAAHKSSMSWSTVLMEVLAMFGGINGLMERFNMSSATPVAGASPETANGHAENGKKDAPVSPSISRRYAPPPSES